jgi:hypothetical protein
MPITDIYVIKELLSHLDESITKAHIDDDDIWADTDG